MIKASRIAWRKTDYSNRMTNIYLAHFWIINTQHKYLEWKLILDSAIIVRLVFTFLVILSPFCLQVFLKAINRPAIVYNED